MSSSSLKSLRDTAILWAGIGLSIVPVMADGSKRPAMHTWVDLQSRILSDDEISEHFKPGIGIGIIGGEISGNLEILDFDVPEEGRWVGHCFFDEWTDQLNAELYDLVYSMPTVRTAGGGIHLYYRCNEVDGNTRLASVPMGGRAPRVGQRQTIIETRGRGGYVLAPGCPPECHPSGGGYTFIRGSLDNIPTITGDQRRAIFAAARSFDDSDGGDSHHEWDASASTSMHRSGSRPGDDYNARVSWNEILEPLGWTFAYNRRSDGAQCWRRPGKPSRERGISATIRTIDGHELFHSFSSNSSPLPFDTSITKFTAYAIINHGGDYEVAARSLGKSGYGEQSRRVIDVSVDIESRRDDDVPWCDVAPGWITKVIELEESSDDAPADLPFSDDAPFDASIIHKEMDQLEVQLFADEEELKKEEANRKSGERIRRRKEEQRKGPGALVWTDFGEEPKKKLTEEGRIKTKFDKPRDTTWLMLKEFFSKEDGVRDIHFQNENFIMWNGQRYRAIKPLSARPRVSNYLSHFAESIGEDEDGNEKYAPHKIMSNRVNEIMNAMQDMVHLDKEILDPCWLCDDDGSLPNPKDVVCCKNGLLDVTNMTMLPPTASFYSFNNTGITYDPDASSPKAWLKFLESSLDEESRTLLQQWFGYCLVQDTSLHKMLMVVGKSNSGKSTAMHVLRKLVGETACCAMSLHNFDSQFGLQNALGKSLMIFPDARQNIKFESRGSAIDSILTITGEDEMYIDIKNAAPITRKLNTRLVIVSNDIIQLTDRSKALGRRMLWVKFPGFEGESDTKLKKKLNSELSGILNWAIDGLAMVRRDGGFVVPSSAKMLKSSFEEQSSDIQSFIDDMCVVGDECFVDKVELVSHWNAWRISKGYKVTGEAMFGKLLSSAVMTLDAERRREGEHRKLVYIGIGLDREKVADYIEEYGGQERWGEMLKPVSSKRSKKTDGTVITISEYIASKKPET